jgi:hypothetical protein
MKLRDFQCCYLKLTAFEERQTRNLTTHHDFEILFGRSACITILKYGRIINFLWKAVATCEWYQHERST